MIFKPEDLLPGCVHFTHREALWLPQWDRMANEGDGLNEQILANLIDLFHRMEKVRAFVNASINVHCAFRPKLYNALVKGAKNSAHLTGQAVDFDVQDVTCTKVKTDILMANKLEELGLRMENNGESASWVHLDTKPVPEGGHRFFKP